MYFYGPCAQVQNYFYTLGYRCPSTKDLAGFILDIPGLHPPATIPPHRRFLLVSHECPPLPSLVFELIGGYRDDASPCRTGKQYKDPNTGPHMSFDVLCARYYASPIAAESMEYACLPTSFHSPLPLGWLPRPPMRSLPCYSAREGAPGLLGVSVFSGAYPDAVGSVVFAARRHSKKAQRFQANMDFSQMAPFLMEGRAACKIVFRRELRKLRGESRRWRMHADLCIIASVLSGTLFFRMDTNDYQNRIGSFFFTSVFLSLVQQTHLISCVNDKVRAPPALPPLRVHSPPCGAHVSRLCLSQQAIKLTECASNFGATTCFVVRPVFLPTCSTLNPSSRSPLLLCRSVNKESAALDIAERDDVGKADGILPLRDSEEWEPAPSSVRECAFVRTGVPRPQPDQHARRTSLQDLQRSHLQYLKAMTAQQHADRLQHEEYLEEQKACKQRLAAKILKHSRHQTLEPIPPGAAWDPTAGAGIEALPAFHPPAGFSKKPPLSIIPPEVPPKPSGDSPTTTKSTEGVFSGHGSQSASPIYRLKRSMMTQRALLGDSDEPHAAQMALWRIRHGFPENTKIFIMAAGYPALRQALLGRGWAENKDKHHTESTVFNLKWALKASNIDQSCLRRRQIVNHFQNARTITTKEGLQRTLRYSRWYAKDMDTYYPRTYDLFQDQELDEFLLDFRWTSAECILKHVVANPCTEFVDPVHLDLALRACKIRCNLLTDLVVQDVLEKDNLRQLTETEWAKLLSSKCFSHKSKIASRGVGGSGCLGTDSLKRASGPLLATPRGGRDSASSPQRAAASPSSLAAQGGSEARRIRAACNSRGKQQQRMCSESVLTHCKQMLASLARTGQCHQQDMDGMYNVWIVKPGGKSRGRGIQTFNSIEDIQKYISTGEDDRWIVQKYIENPLLIHERKFDIRQWALVTDWNPLTVWFYRTCYIRFCAKDYDILDMNVFCHLSNNSIAKYCDGATQGVHGQGNMWTVEEFKEFLQVTKVYPDGAKSWEETLVPQMQDIVRCSLRCATETVDHRKNSCQIFGYDFVLDRNQRVWLLEINSSPAMDPSTPITAKLCPEALEDLCKVIVDVPDERERRREGGTKDTYPEGYDTGGWQPIVFDGREIGKPQFRGENLVVEGTELSIRPCHAGRKKPQETAGKEHKASFH
ncbi:hypothetical protein CYMTET_6171 [Cymbomonas tetramitiformis]|uniref:Uncharacterized protein n=1 Tax=Cymbomonas tetramitiformis TaxID=36881 RepID=A0AAE0LIC3_9CHLO|nr:hypothetical protein CYMTET_6171 [Cymbomonas tetramitiformis]